MFVFTDKKENINEFIDLIKTELNIKEIEFIDNELNFVEIELKPNYETLGKKLVNI